MNPKAGEHRCSELSGLDVGISARYHWSVARQLTSYSLRHWNLRNLTLQQECYLTNTRNFFRNTHGSIMLPPRQPRVFARLGSLAINQLNLRPSVAEVNFEPKQTLTCQNISKTKSVRRRNFNDSGRLMQAFKVKFGNL